MARAEILAGRNLLTERPVPDKRFDGLSKLTTEIAGETQLVALAYDTRHRYPVNNRNTPILILAGDVNRKLYFCDSETMEVWVSFDYPEVKNSALVPSPPANKCYGLAILNEPTDCIIAFLSEKQIEGNPILYHLRFTPPDEAHGIAASLDIQNWYIVNTAAGGAAFDFKANGRGMSEYRNDLMVVGAWHGVDTLANIDYYGMPLAQYPSFTVADKLCGVQYINQRVYTTIDMTSDPDIGSRVLAKFLTENIDRGRMVPLMSIEPFFLTGFNGDITIFQDRMAACYADNVYTYRMCYFMFIVDDLPNDDIDMGSILIGDSKTKRVVLKNIADIYRLKEVTITVDHDGVTCPGGAEMCEAKAATYWVGLSVDNPASSGGATWTYSIKIATAIAPNDPIIEPDGEREFWIKVVIPEYYDGTGADGTKHSDAEIKDGTSNPKKVTVDDGPFCVPLIITARVG